MPGRRARTRRSGRTAGPRRQHVRARVRCPCPTGRRDWSPRACRRSCRRRRRSQTSGMSAPPTSCSRSRGSSLPRSCGRSWRTGSHPSPAAKASPRGWSRSGRLRPVATRARSPRASGSLQDPLASGSAARRCHRPRIAWTVRARRARRSQAQSRRVSRRAGGRAALAGHLRREPPTVWAREAGQPSVSTTIDA